MLSILDRFKRFGDLHFLIRSSKELPFHLHKPALGLIMNFNKRLLLGPLCLAYAASAVWAPATTVDPSHVSNIIYKPNRELTA